jgi:hypothetical protein
MKHEQIVGVEDQVPATFVRTFFACCVAGVALWAAIIAMMF